MLYPMNRRPFDERVFADPPMEYRGVPFWAWNCRVTEDKIDRQTECFRQMGMGGAMVHPRTGMDTEYMSEEYLRLVEYARKRLSEKGMQTWLYDEERFPSGCAGGLVTKDLRFRSRILVISRTRPHTLPVEVFMSGFAVISPKESAFSVSIDSPILNRVTVLPSFAV